jgi:hypothetical protein
MFLKATRATANEATNKAMANAAVLGGSGLGFTVELQDGSQIEVGRTCCKYCARVEAYSKVSTRLAEGRPLCDYAKPKRRALMTGVPTYPEALGKLCYVEVLDPLTCKAVATTLAHSDWGLAVEAAAQLSDIIATQTVQDVTRL